MAPPLRVNLVGTDGTGKTTVVDLLRQKFEADDQPIVTYSMLGVVSPELHYVEPSTRSCGRPWSEYAPDRIRFAQQSIRMALEKAQEIGARVVVGDRASAICNPVYFPTLMEGSALESVTHSEWRDVCERGEYIPPDEVFWLDLDPRVAAERVACSGRSKILPHETEENIATLRRGYEELYRLHQQDQSGLGEHFQRLDISEMTAEQVAEKIWKSVQKKLLRE